MATADPRDETIPAHRPPAVVVPPLHELQQRRSEKWDGAAGVIASTVAEMDFALAEPVAQVLHEAVRRHDLGYAYVATPQLRQGFCGFAARRLGWMVDPEQITLVPDVMVGIIELARHLCGPGGSVAFATPAYPPFIEELPAAGLVTRQIGLLEDGRIDLADLGAALESGTRVLVLANPHNPTGRVLPLDELESLAELCATHDAWVVADEIHAPLVLPGATHTPWLAVSDAARERGVSVTSASKAFNLAGLKAALIVTASERARTVVSRLPPMAEHAGLLGVLAAEVAFTECDGWLDAVIAQLDTNRTTLAESLPSLVPEVRWVPPQATYLAWLDFSRTRIGDDPARAILAGAGLALSPGLDYGPAGSGFARLNFGTSPDILRESIRRITQVVTG